jgi:HD superfamily phosphohydrolase YqeK
MLSVKEARRIAAEGDRYSHPFNVGSIMRNLAEYYGQDEDLWEVVGVLYDIDYNETIGNRELHGVIAAERLKDRLPENALHAIRSHDHRTGYTPNTALDKALIFADALDHVFQSMKDVKTFSYEVFLLHLDQETEKGRPWMLEIMQTYIKENNLSPGIIERLWNKTYNRKCE